MPESGMPAPYYGKATPDSKNEPKTKDIWKIGIFIV